MQLAIEILDFIKKKPRASPLWIARKLLRRPGLVRNYLVILLELHLVDTPVRGNYIITPLGEYVLEYLKESARSAS